MTDKNNNHLHAKYIYGNEYHFMYPHKRLSTMLNITCHSLQYWSLQYWLPKLQLALNNSFSIDLPAIMKF